jgi:hypothetical protein
LTPFQPVHDVFLIGSARAALANESDTTALLIMMYMYKSWELKDPSRLLLKPIFEIG